MEDEAPMEDAPEGAEAETSPAPDDAYDDVEPESPTAAEDEAPASTSLVFADLDAEAKGGSTPWPTTRRRGWRYSTKSWA